TLRDDGANGYVPTRQRLRDRHEIGLHVPLLVREERAGPAEAGLHLVDREQCAAAMTELGAFAQVALGRDEHALALDGLDHERRDVAYFELALQGIEVAEGNALTAGQEVAEPIAEFAPAV